MLGFDLGQLQSRRGRAARLSLLSYREQILNAIGGEDGDTPQPLKRRGFLGQPAHWRAYAPTGLSSPVQDVDCGVVVSIKRKATAAINPAIR